MSREKLTSVFQKYIPASAVEICVGWIIQKNIHLKITRGRASKFGDYRPLGAGKGHSISVNHDLNQYAFLITFIHEVAHLHAYVKIKRYHEPHGKEWKNEFRELLEDFIVRGIFPDDIKDALTEYIRNPAASSCTDHHLFRTLKKYDLRSENVKHLEELPADCTFRLHQSRSQLVFRKGPLLRRRFHCMEITTNRIYFVSPLAEVVVKD